MNTRKIIHFAIGPIGAAALSLITLPFVTWFFSVEDVGRLTMLQVTLGLSVSLFSLGLHQAYVREYHEENDKGALLKAAMLPGAALLIFCSVVLVLLPYSISEVFFDIDSGKLTFLLVLGVFSSFLINFLAHIVRMQERGLAFSATQVLPRLALLIFIGLILLLGLTNSFENLMSMSVLSLISSLTLFLGLTRRSWLPALQARLNVVLMKKMLRFSLPLLAGSLAYWGLTTMDRFFLRMYSGLEELGVYAVSATLAGAVGVVSTIFSNLWHPMVYKWVKEGADPSRIQRVYENMMIFVALLWSSAGMLSWVLVYFLPAEYKAIEYLIVACISMPLFYMLSETTVVGIGITRKTSFSMFASIAAFVVNALLNYILIPEYGASGAALASVVAFFVFFVLRTESSAYLWQSFPRVKLYIVSSCYMIATAVMVLNKAGIKHFIFVWMVVLLVTILLFAVRLKESVCFAKNYITRVR